MKYFLYLCFTIFIACTTSCALKKNIDNVEGTNPKGFVKFYTNYSNGISIYEDNKWLWTINTMWSLKVAKSPGYHCFSASAMDSNKFPFCVDIKDGLLTPVFISFGKLIGKNLISREISLSVEEMRQQTPED
jgi:hypothetical protein